MILKWFAAAFHSGIAWTPLISSTWACQVYLISVYPWLGRIRDGRSVIWQKYTDWPILSRKKNVRSTDWDTERRLPFFRSVSDPMLDDSKTYVGQIYGALSLNSWDNEEFQRGSDRVCVAPNEHFWHITITVNDDQEFAVENVGVNHGNVKRQEKQYMDIKKWGCNYRFKSFNADVVQSANQRTWRLYYIGAEWVDLMAIFMFQIMFW